MGGEDGKLNSKWVEKMRNYTLNGWRRWEITLEMGGEDCVGPVPPVNSNFIAPSTQGKYTTNE